VFHPSPALVLSIDPFVPVLLPNSERCYVEKITEDTPLDLSGKVQQPRTVLKFMFYR